MKESPWDPVSALRRRLLPRGRRTRLTNAGTRLPLGDQQAQEGALAFISRASWGGRTGLRLLWHLEKAKRF